MSAHKGSEPMFIGQREIEQHDIEMVAAEPCERGIEPVDVLELQIAGASFADQFEEEPRIARVVLDEQGVNAFQGHLLNRNLTRVRSTPDSTTAAVSLTERVTESLPAFGHK